MGLEEAQSLARWPRWEGAREFGSAEGLRKTLLTMLEQLLYIQHPP